ncbi:DEAD/DEAH box helicase [Nonomuraea longicatena]|uniref:Helicase n=1 Tax=Nonomuraea longicatena TaxID=83682 RepID=A0ABN1PWU9_9ACTN
MSSVDSSVLQVVLGQSERVLETYRIDPGLVQEHANNERRIKEGGYGTRQIYELVQNGADELRNTPNGEIAVVLTTSHLYCANEGSAITPEGADTILRMGVSRKRGGQIGRFGVGVKSVLSVTDMPEFYSKEDGKSFGFDKEWAAKEIRAVQPSAVETPVLRIARPLDRERAAADDPVLRELLTWATTVVRLPLKPGAVNRLAKDIAEFPAEFSLFSPHVETVTLEDRRSSKTIARQVFLRSTGDRRELQMETTGKSTRVSDWRVFTRSHTPSARALEEAGELHDRPVIDVSWAVPTEVRRDRGQFWAYFPTNYASTLKGIVNAPWKTSEDRQNLYNHNAFNHELIGVVAQLVVESLPKLASEYDPCAHLDVLPARGREETQWAADELVHAIWTVAAHQPVVPDQNGVFGTVAEVHMHPDKLDSSWLRRWAEHPGRPANWCDHSVEEGHYRRERVGYIQSAAGVAPKTAREWLEALVADETPEASARAITIAWEMSRKGHNQADDAMRARIVLTENLGLVPPSNKIFRRSGDDDLTDNTVYVDERVYAGDPEVIRALNELGVHEADHRGRLASVVEQGFHGYADRQWISFWELVRLAGPAGTLDAFRGREDVKARLKVKTVDGGFRRIDECLLPGRIVPADGSRDSRIAVDTGFHGDDRSVLKDLGLLDGPAERHDPREDSVFVDYTRDLWEAHCAGLPASDHRPQHATMAFDGSMPAGPLRLLTELSPEGRAAFLAHLPIGGVVANWTMQVGRQTSTRKSVMSPLKWTARRHGYVETSRGLRQVVRSVGPDLKSHEHLLPVAKVSTSVANVLGLPHTFGEIEPRLWAELVDEAAGTADDAFAGKVYALILEAGVDWPAEGAVRCRLGDEARTDVAVTEIVVTGSRVQYETLVGEQIPALLAPSETAALSMREHWKMLSPDDVIQKELRWAGVEEVRLTEEFPHLKVRVRNQVEGWTLVRCEELGEVVRTPKGMRTTEMPTAAHFGDRKVFVRQPVDDLATLLAVDVELKLGLGADQCRNILGLREQQRNHERLRRARQAPDIADKMLELIGVEALRKGLPHGLLESDEAETGTPATDRRVARLAVNAYGDELLRVYRDDIAASVPDAAATFRGDSKSIRVVNDLDLPENYAGTRSDPLPPVERVQGPKAFPRLHDYQERLTQKTFDLLTRWENPRAMLCLPTGAGKTRVAVEAIIRVVKEQGLNGRPILWIAQSQELCEQAVQTWSFVWAKVGPPEQLTINRLWGSRDAAASKDTAHLVVATDANLEKRLERPEYGWLRDAAIVIVDEAHFSITPRYTDLFRTLGITYRETSRPLIGLTATPYRGFNAQETRRLVERYGGTRLDEGIFRSDPYEELQELGVLAKVEHRELKGTTLTLTEEELKGTEEFQGAWLPRSVEATLARDADRNAMLLKEIERLPVGSPVLLFAASVSHAKVLVAKLNGRGIPAAAIDSTTPDSDRRARIEEFRSKKIRVLANHGVLAQGFDAPATEVVVVARPTYSPNAYQQMIGRGLRGPLNNGGSTCLILDVADNIVNYDKKLAFTEFEHLWSRR